MLPCQRINEAFSGGAYFTDGRLRMNTRQIVSSIGAVIAVYGIVSSILYFIGYNMRLLVWIDQWGSIAGWIIRVALVIVGGVMYLIGRKTA
jgi:hypothetical protein